MGLLRDSSLKSPYLRQYRSQFTRAQRLWKRYLAFSQVRNEHECGGCGEKEEELSMHINKRCIASHTPHTPHTMSEKFGSSL